MTIQTTRSGTHPQAHPRRDTVAPMSTVERGLVRPGIQGRRRLGKDALWSRYHPLRGSRYTELSFLKLPTHHTLSYPP